MPDLDPLSASSVRIDLPTVTNTHLNRQLGNLIPARSHALIASMLMVLLSGPVVSDTNTNDSDTTDVSSSNLSTTVTTAASSESSEYEASTTLGSMGSSENPRRTGDAIQTVCGQFIANGTNTAAELDLFQRCGNMVHNANEIANSGGATSNSLGLDQAGLVAAVWTLANEEMAVTKSMATEISSAQRSTGNARLNVVRGNNAYGAVALSFDPFSALAGTLGAENASNALRGGAAGDAVFGKWGSFANLSYGFGDRDRTTNEDGFDFDQWGLDIGGDYRLNDATVVGGFVSYAGNETEFHKLPAVPGGGIDSHSWGVSLYGTHYTKNYYIDGLLGFTRARYDIDRKILLPLGAAPGGSGTVVTTDRDAKGKTDSNAINASLGAGIDLVYRNINYGPFARITYQKTDIDGYAETGAFGLNLTVDDQDWTSLTSVFGVRGSFPISREWGVLTPQMRLAWVHEFKNDSQIMSAFYSNDPRRNALTIVTDDPDRNYIEMGVGVSAVMQNGLQAFADVQTVLGHEYINDYRITFGMRKEF